MMKMKSNWKMLWYLIPLAVIVGALDGAGIFTLDANGMAMIGTIFVIGGLLMGWFNISKKEQTASMLIAILFATVGTSFAVISFFDIVTGMIAGIVTYLAMVMIPAAIVVALKESKKIAG